MKFVLLENFKIVNEDADFAVGRIRSANGRVGPFQVFASVTADDCGSVQVGIARTFDECVATLADYYERNPPRWFRKSAGWYEKDTLYSHLSVEQDQQGRWRAERDGFPLLQGRGETATFLTLEEAQRLADTHLLDNYPNTKPMFDDGFWWVVDPELDWRLLPECVEGHARWKPLASLWRA